MINIYLEQDIGEDLFGYQSIILCSEVYISTISIMCLKIHSETMAVLLMRKISTKN